MVWIISFITFTSMMVNAQVGLGFYSKKDNKAYVLTEFGLGVSSFKTRYRPYDNFLVVNTDSDRSLNIYSNLGLMFKANQEWSFGFYGTINLQTQNSFSDSNFGVRTRFSRHFGNDIEWNVSPGIRFGTGENNIGAYDIESTVSWNDHIGIFTRYERHNTSRYRFIESSSAISIGLFTKGKKGMYSTIGTAGGVLTAAAILFSVFSFN